jgi:prevent-host-death family protein
MEQIIGITNARNNIKEIIDSISDKNETYIVTRDSIPEAVLISYSKYTENKKLIEKIAELQYENSMKKSKSQLKEWLQQKGVDIKDLPEEEILDMIKNLHINNIYE